MSGFVEPLLASCDAVMGEIDQRQLFAAILNHLSPATVPGPDLEDGTSWNKRMDARKDGAEPLRFGTTPPLGPLLALVRPII